jgi:hypothetical protein
MAINALNGSWRCSRIGTGPNDLIPIGDARTIVITPDSRRYKCRRQMRTAHGRIRLGEEVEKDFARILRYTKDELSRRQLEFYQRTLFET